MWNSCCRKKKDSLWKPLCELAVIEGSPVWAHRNDGLAFLKRFAQIFPARFIRNELISKSIVCHKSWNCVFLATLELIQPHLFRRLNLASDQQGILLSAQQPARNLSLSTSFLWFRNEVITQRLIQPCHCVLGGHYKWEFVLVSALLWDKLRFQKQELKIKLSSTQKLHSSWCTTAEAKPWKPRSNLHTSYA